MLPELTALLLQDWGRLFPEASKPERIRYLGFPGAPEGGTSTFLAFGVGRSAPLFAVKVHRDPNACDLVRNEREVLDLLHSVGGTLADSVPRALFAGCIGRQWVLVQSILEGGPMPASIDSAGIPNLGEAEENFELVTDWLRELHEHTTVQAHEALCAERSRLYRVLDEFEACFALSREEKVLVRRLHGEVDGALCEGLSLRHGDFCRHNVLVGRGDRTRIGVIDWTFAKRVGLPLHDLFFFFAGYFAQIRRELGTESFLRIFEYTFLGKNSYSNLVKREIEKYCGRLRLELRRVADWFTLFLVERAVFELRQTLACAREFGLPRFVVYLGAAAGRAYEDALAEQIWFRYFRRFVAERSAFIV